MMNALEIKEINFLGDSLMAAKDEKGVIWAGVSYICKGIGLNKNEKDRQIKNVQQDCILKQGCVKFDAGVFDPNNATLALQLDFIPLWLAKISITPTMEKETPEIAEKLVNYQLKAKDVLAAAFLPQARPMTQAEIIAVQAQILVDIERSQNEIKRSLDDTNKRIDNIGEIVALNPNSWRKDSKSIISKIAQTMGGFEYIQEVNHEIYALVDTRAGCSLATRLTNKRNRMAGEGACKSQRDKLNKVDIIAEDKKLIEIYLSIVKELAIKNGVGVSHIL